jgi:glutamine transport system substrate-binding protein
VADITINEERKKVVDFTVPFFTSGISALMLKSHYSQIKTWNNLSNQTAITYGILENGPTRRIFESSTDPIVQRLWKNISSNSSNFVFSYTEALRRITNGNYIFIGESSHIQYLVSNRCDLTKIDSNLPHNRRYGIALLQNSPLINSFNAAINQLISNGKIDELKRKWWRSKCDSVN